MIKEQMKKIDPLPIPMEDGGASFKDATCEAICYRLNKEGLSVSSCEFLELAPAWPVTEFYCSMPGDG